MAQPPSIIQRIRLALTGQQQVNQGIGSIGSTLKNLAGVAAGVFAVGKLVDWTKAMWEAGTTAGETASKFSTTFGESTRAMDEFIASFAHGAGMTKTEGRDMTSTIGAITQGMGAAKDESAKFSQEMITLAADLQSFHNVPIAEALGAMKSGLVGSFEPLDRFGIVIRQSDVNLRALTMTGKTNEKQLTNLEKAQASLNLMVERAGPALGDLGRTQESTSNRARTMQATWREMKDEIAVGLIPAFDVFVTSLAEATGAVEGNAGWLTTHKEAVGAWAKVVVALIKFVVSVFLDVPRTLVHLGMAVERFWDSLVANSRAALGRWQNQFADTLNGLIEKFNSLPFVVDISWRMPKLDANALRKEANRVGEAYAESLGRAGELASRTQNSLAGLVDAWQNAQATMGRTNEVELLTGTGNDAGGGAPPAAPANDAAGKKAKQAADAEAKRREEAQKRNAALAAELALVKEMVPAARALSDVQGKARESVEAVLTAHKELLEVQGQIDAAGGAAFSPQELLDARDAAAELLEQAKAIARLTMDDPDSFLTDAALKARDTIRDTARELEQMHPAAVQGWTQQQESVQRLDERLTDLRSTLLELSGDQSATGRAYAAQIREQIGLLTSARALEQGRMDGIKELLAPLNQALDTASQAREKLRAAFASGDKESIRSGQLNQQMADEAARDAYTQAMMTLDRMGLPPEVAEAVRAMVNDEMAYTGISTFAVSAFGVELIGSLEEAQALASEVAEGFTEAWGEAFGLLFQDIDNLDEAWGALMTGMGSAVLGALNTLAKGKVQENVASAIENLAKGLSAASNPFTAPMAGGYFAAAAKHGVAAAAWGVLAGAAGGAASAMGGGRAGGVGSGNGNAGSDRAAGSEPRNVVNVYMDPLDPRNARWQDNQMETMRYANERWGGDGYEVNTYPAA